MNRAIKIDAIAARGGPLKPLKSGVYKINSKMLTEYKEEVFASHASNLGALLAHELQSVFNAKAFIVDPVTVDDFFDVARVSGVRGIERKSRSHALNIRYCTKKAANNLGINIDNSNFITAHLGSGFSIAAVKNGKIIDVNDALLGMGPFSVERAGALPTMGILDLVFKNRMSREEIEYILSKESGIKSYLRTNDFKKIENKISKKDKATEHIVNAMVYQIVKEIGALYATYNGKIDALVITGGLANSALLMKKVGSYLDFIKNKIIYPGSFELEALAEGVMLILCGIEKVKTYK